MRIVFIGTGEIGLPALRALARLAARTKSSAPSRSRTNRSVARNGSRLRRSRRKSATSFASRPATGANPRAGRRRGNSRAQSGRHRRHGLWPNLAQRLARNSARRLSQLARLAPSAAPRRGADPGRDRRRRQRDRASPSCIWMRDSIPATSSLQSRLTIAPNETGGSLHDRLAHLAPEAIARSARSTDRRERSAHAAGCFPRDLRAETGARKWPDRLVGTGGNDRAKNSRLRSLAGSVRSAQSMRPENRAT